MLGTIAGKGRMPVKLIEQVQQRNATQITGGSSAHLIPQTPSMTARHLHPGLQSYSSTPGATPSLTPPRTFMSSLQVRVSNAQDCCTPQVNRTVSRLNVNDIGMQKSNPWRKYVITQTPEAQLLPQQTCAYGGDTSDQNIDQSSWLLQGAASSVAADNKGAEMLLAYDEELPPEDCAEGADESDDGGARRMLRSHAAAAAAAAAGSAGNGTGFKRAALQVCA